VCVRNRCRHAPCTAAGADLVSLSFEHVNVHCNRFCVAVHFFFILEGALYATSKYALTLLFFFLEHASVPLECRRLHKCD
jgi:hypothetical protein